MIVREDMELIFEEIPDLKAMMPTEYGGTRGLFERIWSKLCHYNIIT